MDGKIQSIFSCARTSEIQWFSSSFQVQIMAEHVVSKYDSQKVIGCQLTHVVVTRLQLCTGKYHKCLGYMHETYVNGSENSNKLGMKLVQTVHW